MRKLFLKTPQNYSFLFFLQIENLQDQLRDKEKQLSGLKDRVKSLQTDTSNTDTALGTLEEALAEKVYTHARTRSPDRLTLEQGCINKILMSKTADHPQDDQMALDKWKSTNNHTGCFIIKSSRACVHKRLGTVQCAATWLKVVHWSLFGFGHSGTLATEPTVLWLCSQWGFNPDSGNLTSDI